MRALTQEEYEVLRNIDADEDLDDEPWKRLCSVLEKLSRRGLVVLAWRAYDDAEGVDCDVTPLGRLALRVSRPDQPVALP